MKIEAIEMDITKLGSRVDVIVNAANRHLGPGGGVDGAIHRAAGPELARECATLGGCRPGEAKVTRAYRLNNKYIIHTVGPQYDYDQTPGETLARSYLNCLLLADSLGVESIAFPSISTGIYHYPVEEAAEICARVVCSYKPKHLKQAYMCIYGDLSKIKTYNDAFLKYSKQDND